MRPGVSSTFAGDVKQSAKIVRDVCNRKILIQIPSELTLCIENKVGAYDQKNQMGRYLSWLKNEVNTKGTRIAVYLSPDGRSPQDPPAAVDLPPLKLLSYKAVADWLQRQPSPERLSTVIRMYIETCKKISGVRLKTPYNDEIEKLLSSPEKFAIALDIADFIALEKPRITERFWKNVCDFLNERLSDALLSNRWKTHLSMEKTGWLAIVKTEIGIDSACGSLGHALTVEGIKTTAACFGIRRGSRKRIDVVDPVDDELVHQLTGLPFKENDWWCGYRGISAGGLLPGTSDANGHVSLFQKDYQETGNPLSVQVADALWNLFSQCRERLEHINKAQHDT